MKITFTVSTFLLLLSKLVAIHDERDWWMNALKSMFGEFYSAGGALRRSMVKRTLDAPIDVIKRTIESILSEGERRGRSSCVGQSWDIVDRSR